MKLLVFGSLNLDTVLQVDHFVSAGETLQALEVQVYPGGKGLNQAIAVARAGGTVHMAGTVGQDGRLLLDLMAENNVHYELVHKTDGLTGAAYIQVDRTGQNCIVIAGNANTRNTEDRIRDVLVHFDAGDLLLLQNEINLLDELIRQASNKGMRIYLNPSPFNAAIMASPLERISGFILNEVEGFQMTGETEPARILDMLLSRYPDADLILTLGPRGAIFKNREMTIHQKCYEGEPVDTTAAGDTFTGYYLASLQSGSDQATAMRLASKAAAIAVTIPGATSSIPRLADVLRSPIVEMP